MTTDLPEKMAMLPLGGMECIKCGVFVLLDNKGCCPNCGYDQAEMF